MCAMLPKNPKTGQVLTKIFVGILIVCALIWDIVILLVFGTEATISQVVYTYSRQYPLIPLVAGIVTGHLFWPNCESENGEV